MGYVSRIVKTRSANNHRDGPGAVRAYVDAIARRRTIIFWNTSWLAIFASVGICRTGRRSREALYHGGRGGLATRSRNLGLTY